MIVALRIGRPARAWHRHLAHRLEAAGHRVAIEPGAACPLPAVGIRTLLGLEASLFRSRAALFEPLDTPLAGQADAEEAAVRIVLDAGAGPSDLEPTFDGIPGEVGLWRALLAGRAPLVAVRAGRAVLAAGLPAIEDPRRLSRALDAVLSRLVTLLLQAVEGTEPRRAARPEPLAGDPVSASAFLRRGVVEKLARRLGRAKGRADHWRIAYRLGGDRTAPQQGWPEARYLPLADDGRRFYADPFPFVEQGRRLVFFEDFPYATGKGVIGCVEIDAEGGPSAPRTVLEASCHLSYPFLLREGEAIYMLPEMTGARRVQLHRADPFPDRWVPDRVLIDDIVASDATIVRHGERWWLFATLSDGTDSTWDQLGLFHAPALFGPWTAHPGNPVLIDAGSARPAGAMWHEDGALMRTAQDCRAGYGAGLALCRVDRLDERGFAQTVVARLGPPGGWEAEGVHTLNRCGDLETIDLRVPHPRG